MASTLKFTEHRYDTEHELQTLCTWEFPSPPPASASSPPTQAKRHWIVYIHGGAWRDPRTTAALGFIPTIDSLFSSPPTPPGDLIAGFASLSYRASPSRYQPPPPETPPYYYRGAKHPDHVRDVLAGLRYLHAHVVGGDTDGWEYVLVGHSCGATLAMQVAMNLGGGWDADASVDRERSLPLPTAIVGIEGLYDLRAINKRVNGDYTDLWAGAFGPDQKVWDSVSPALFSGWDKVAQAAKRLLIILAWSPGDELVDEGEVDAMAATLETVKGSVRTVVMKDLVGLHDEVHEKGHEVAKVLWRTLDELAKP